MARTKEFDESLVLERARNLFWEQGYTATSIQDLEQRLGISRSSIYRFFGGKRQLYDRTLAEYQVENLGRLQNALLRTDDVQQQLLNIFTGMAREVHPDCKAEARGCYIVNATTEMANNCAEALSFVAENRVKFVAIMEKALARAQVQGKLEAGADAKAWAEYLYLCFNGLQVVVQTKMDREALVKAVTRSINALPWC